MRQHSVSPVLKSRESERNRLFASEVLAVDYKGSLSLMGECFSWSVKTLFWILWTWAPVLARVKYCCTKNFSLSIQKEFSIALHVYSLKEEFLCAFCGQMLVKANAKPWHHIKARKIAWETELFLFHFLSQSSPFLWKPSYNCSISICMSLWGTILQKLHIFSQGLFFIWISSLIWLTMQPHKYLWWHSTTDDLREIVRVGESGDCFIGNHVHLKEYQTVA